MTLRNLLIALVTACIMAWTIQARAQHSGPPGQSPEEECTRDCHIKHCDEWLNCASAADLTRCRAEVNRHEADCMRKCAPEKM